VAAQLADPSSLLAHYRELIRLRHGSEALAKGQLELVEAADPAVLAYLRRTPAETVLVAHNLGGREASVELPLRSAAVDALFTAPGATVEPAADRLTVTLPPRASAILRSGGTP
jgi:glycosidase